MAELDRPDQELTPGYYDNQFAHRVGNLTKAGAEPPAPSGNTGGSGGCLKGGGGVIFLVVLVLRVLTSLGGRDTPRPTYTIPTIQTPRIQPVNPGGPNQWNPDGNPGFGDPQRNPWNRDRFGPRERPDIRFPNPDKGDKGDVGPVPDPEQPGEGEGRKFEPRQ